MFTAISDTIKPKAALYGTAFISYYDICFLKLYQSCLSSLSNVSQKRAENEGGVFFA